AFFDNADEPELELPDTAIAARRAAIEGEAVALEAGLAGRFPAAAARTSSVPDAALRRAHLKARMAEWEAAITPVRWTPVRPAPAIDGTRDTGWTVKGGTGRPHAAVFEFREPVGGRRGTRLSVTLRQEGIHQMTIGRFRLSVTTDAPPVSASGLPAELEDVLL